MFEGPTNVQTMALITAITLRKSNNTHRYDTTDIVLCNALILPSPVVFLNDH